MDVKNASGNIIFCCTSVSSFVAKDIQILTHAGYTVTPLLFIWHPKWRLPVTFLKQFFQLFYYLFTCRAVVVQFGGMHAFLPVIMAKIWRKPSLVILGGTDCAKFPSIAYGNFNKKILGWFTAQSVKHAMHLAPKHASLMWFDYTYDTSDYTAQGIQCFTPNLKTPYTVIENGYDANIFKKVSDKKPNTFLTVAAGVELPNTMALKGIDLILKIAPHFSHCTFTIVGVPADFILPVQLKNVITLPQQNAAQLIQLYSMHTFYMQLSMSEGFPNAICEAMLCQCIPIGSNVNAIPDIMGNTGYLLQHRNIDLLTNLVTRALNEVADTKGILARQRIAENFSIEQRSQKLLKLIQQLLQ